MKVIAYQTHYEIEDYDIGDCYELEKQFKTFDEVNFTEDFYYRYDNRSRILYIPRGFDKTKLESLLHVPVINSGTCNTHLRTVFNMKLGPRYQVQKESIRFLLGKDEYKYTTKASQLVLSLPGGVGKTYCMVAALSYLCMKFIVIVHNAEIREQWRARLLQYTNMPDSAIITVTSTKTLHNMMKDKKIRNHSCYLVTHRLLGNYMKEYGFDSLNELFIHLGIGAKVVDEAHKEFKEILEIDYATNVKKSYYLSATFGKTDYKENMIFQKSFNQVYKLSKSSDEIGIERTTYYIASFFKSGISAIESMSMKIRYKFSVQRYFNIEMEYGAIFKQVNKWLEWVYITKQVTGKTFILSPKKDSCDICYKLAKELFPDKKCCVHYTGSKVDNLSDYDIICATSKMLGTGLDLDDLRCIINLEPIGSAVNIDQIIHRLMRGKSTEPTYFIDVVDKSVPHTITMYNRRLKTVKKFVKNIIEIGK